MDSHAGCRKHLQRTGDEFRSKAGAAYSDCYNMLKGLAGRARNSFLKDTGGKKFDLLSCRLYCRRCIHAVYNNRPVRKISGGCMKRGPVFRNVYLFSFCHGMKLSFDSPGFSQLKEKVHCHFIDPLSRKIIEEASAAQ